MKRFITLLVILCLCVSLCACSNNKSTQTETTVETTVETTAETKPPAIDLTLSNWKEYLHIENETQNYVCNVTEVLGYKFADGTADCVMNISKTVPCDFYNAVLYLRVYSTSLAWDEAEQNVEIHISADGSATKSVTFSSEDSLPGILKEPMFSFEVVNVSGKVQPAS